jgi:hypothetical protein
MFREAYCLEKIHGTTTSVKWNPETDVVHYHSSIVGTKKFMPLFDADLVKSRFKEMFQTKHVAIYGEGYGERIQSMSKTYGKDPKFVAFDVLVDDVWLSVPNAHDVVSKFNIEFVDYVKTDADIAAFDEQRDKESVQAIRNGCGSGHTREGIVIRPLIEFRRNNGSRVIAKHRHFKFSETKTPRAITAEDLKVLSDAREIAEEWVTDMRLTHVLDKLSPNLTVKETGDVIKSMIEDIEREGEGEIVMSKDAIKLIGHKTADMFKQILNNKGTDNAS